jgi:CBS domain-containing protein
MATVGEVMSTEVVTVSPSTSVAEAATVMAEKRVGSALVLEDGLVGIFTERDIVRALSQDFDAPGHPVTHWMTKDPVTVGPETTVEEAMDRMLAGGFRHLPVMDGDKILGIVSIRDLSRARAEG